MVKQFLQLLGAIFVGLILSLWIIQSNTKIEQAVANKIIAELEKNWDVKINTTSQHINIFNFSLYLHNGKVKYSKKEDCYWEFDQCKIHLQPLDFLLNKKINLQITFDNVNTHSRINKATPDIVTHIAEIFSYGASAIPISAKYIRINNLTFNTLNDSHSFQVLINGSFTMKKIRHAKKQSLENSWQGDLVIQDAQISVDNKVLAQNITTSGLFYRKIKSSSWDIQIDNLIKYFMPDTSQTYNINSIWNKDNKRTVIKNSTSDLNISYIDNKISIKGNLPINTVLNTFSFFKPNTEVDYSNISGICNFDLSWQMQNAQLDPSSNISFDKLKIKDIEFKKIALNLKKNSCKSLMATVDITYQEELEALGILKWRWDKSSGKINLMNKLPLKFFKGSNKQLGITGYEIKPNNLSIKASFDNSFNFIGNYKISAIDPSTNKNMKLYGDFKIEKNRLETKGKTQKGVYLVYANIWPSLCILKWIYQVNKRKLIDLECRDLASKILAGDIDYLLIKSFLAQNTRSLILGRNCILNLKLDQTDFLNLHGFLKLGSGKFYIPESRNLVEKFQTDFEIKIPDKITLTNVYIGCFKGELSSPKALIQFDENKEISTLHIPLQIKDLLINWRKDLLAIIYGNILIKKEQDGEYKASAQLIAKKSLLKENIFSLPENTTFSDPLGITFLQDKNIDFDIKISSEHPIKAKTPTLETDATINLRILYQKNKSVMHAPQLTGTIKLDNGYIKFLKTKLYIEYGKIQFISNQMNDPIIDLIARNRINKYQITLQATGSLQKPTILLESNPELTDEQILGLLLSGSEAAKLQTDLLAMLEQNLHDIILGNKAVSSGVTSFFQKLAKPLKYIQISPDFTNQAARGGIKGTVSVNISDQVKAQIQKNFNLQDDFNAQVEYQISDDINIKGSLDQRGELGAEVELRLKL
jgi:hypothetical protein